MKDAFDKIMADAQQGPTWLACRKAARRINELFASGQTETKASLKVAFVSSFTIDPLVDFTVVQAASSRIRLERTTLASLMKI